MTQQEFDKIAESYLAGNCSPDEISLLQEWADLHCTADNLTLAFKNETDIQQTERKLWDRIQSNTVPIRKLNWLTRSRNLWAVGIAASLMLFFFAFPYLFQNQSTDSKRGIETKNVADSRQTTVLPDGSIVVLGKNASITTDVSYGKQTRTVYLTGEAFFDVKHNTQLPFLVHVGELVTEVLGTSFYIKPQLAGKTVEVIVKTGKVSVYTINRKDAKKLNGVIITSNQKALYDAQSKTITPNLIDNPELINAATLLPVLTFNEKTIETILPLLSKAYGVEIVVANPNLKQCVFTGNLTGLPMYDQLELICGAINAQLEVRGTTIFISGDGCSTQ
ncbi:FecR family protein [Spirosoma endbachense]|uniref:DUF4974 domain-containing protein n=1 Tax=Spirosoma endbachense TaxID=2666025 RepID=A0A6P1VXL5_9BACT|nr:FecR family protein [Spirosoma endbachense]QHV96537.1 DUF4974 domain-containing protein [Spirosoma endbachense]